MIEIRKRTDDDLLKCVAVLERVYSEFAYPAQWPQDPAAWIANETEQDAWVGITTNGEIAGHVDRRVSTDHPVTSLWCDAAGRDETELAVVSRLFIAPDQLGRGFGTALLSTAIERCLALNVTPVLSVLAEHENAISFYEKRGWKQVGITNDTWAEATKPIRVVAMIGPVS